MVRQPLSSASADCRRHRRRGLPRSTNMDLRKLETARRIGARHGMKWALIWVAVALIAAPAIGRYIEKQGK